MVFGKNQDIRHRINWCQWGVFVQYLSFLDGIRAIAVGSVVLYHLNSALIANGYLGVDIFFVISGFVVSYSIAQRPSRGFVAFVVDFYARRFTRIVPALVVCLLTTSYATALFIPDAWLSTSIDETGRSAFFGLSNMFLARGTDYFSPVTDFNPFTHTWSLAVEEQFYVLFPLLFFPWMIGAKSKYLSLTVYGLSFLASIAVWFSLRSSAPLEAFYMTYARFWELAFGVICYQVSDLARQYQVENKRIGASARVIASASLMGLAAALFLKLSAQYGWINNVAAVLATGFLITSLQRRDISSARFLALLQSGPVKFLGKISYSLYLWHWPVFVLARWTFGIDTPLQMGTALSLAIILSLASYYLVETPVRTSNFLRQIPRYSVVALGLIAIAGSWRGFEYLVTDKAKIALSVVMKNRTDWIPDITRTSFPDIPNCVIQPTAHPLGIIYGRTGCEAPINSARVYILGDSHAGAYIPMLQRFTLLTGIPTIWLNTNGCPVASLQWARDSEPSCMASTTKALQTLASEARAGDIMFLPSLRMPRIGEQYFQSSDENAKDSVFSSAAVSERSKAVEYAVEKLQPLASQGIRILFEEPKPIFRSPTFRCNDWFNKSNPSCKDGSSIERSFVQELRMPIIDGFSTIGSRIPNVGIWDPMTTLCPNDPCHAFLGKKPLYFDGDHVSGFADVILTPDFTKTVLNLLKQQIRPSDIATR